MKKKFSNEEIGQIIGKVADKIRSDMDYDFRVVQSQMWIAKKNLVYALDERQKKLYDNFYKKRDDFFNIAGDIYKRKF